MLVVAGIKDQVIVNTKNAILVTKKESSNLLRSAMKILIKKNKAEAFDDSIISRPWGLFENIKHEPGYKVKKLLFLGSSCIYPKLSPQPMKEEHLLSGELE